MFLVGPPVIYVEVTTAWYYYESGVLSSADAECADTSSSVNHAVQLVGFMQDPTEPYWIIRNSWGDDWGVNGYVYLAMDDKACGAGWWTYFAEAEPNEPRMSPSNEPAAPERPCVRLPVEPCAPPGPISAAGTWWRACACAWWCGCMCACAASAWWPGYMT